MQSKFIMMLIVLVSLSTACSPKQDTGYECSGLIEETVLIPMTDEQQSQAESFWLQTLLGRNVALQGSKKNAKDISFRFEYSFKMKDDFTLKMAGRDFPDSFNLDTDFRRWSVSKDSSDEIKFSFIPRDQAKISESSDELRYIAFNKTKEVISINVIKRDGRYKKIISTNISAVCKLPSRSLSTGIIEKNIKNSAENSEVALSGKEDKQVNVKLPKMLAVNEYIDLSEDEDLKLYFPNPNQRPDYRHLQSNGSFIDGLTKNGWIEVTDDREKCSIEKAQKSDGVTFPRVDGISCFQKDSLILMYGFRIEGLENYDVRLYLTKH
jgi:hypothetical protein